MDVCGIFLGDSNISYGYMRSALYRDYEQFPYGTLENSKSSPFKDSYSKVKEKCEMIKTQKNGKQSCPFCKEHKKRPLISYLRRRDIQKNHEKICEEDEEEAQEEDNCVEGDHHHHSQKHNIEHRELSKEQQKLDQINV